MQRSYRFPFLVMLLLGSTAALLADYQVVMVSGQTFHCEKKYELLDGDMVRFQAIDGPELTVPKDKIDWYQTALLNGEEPPKRPRLKDPNKPSPFQNIPLPEELREILKNSQNVDPLKQLGLALVTLLLQSLLLWLAFMIFGEPASFLKCLLWHLLIGVVWTILILLFLVAGALVLWPFSQDTGLVEILIPFMFVFFVIFGFFFHFWMMAKFFGCGYFKACLASLVYGLMYLIISLLPFFYFLRDFG